MTARELIDVANLVLLMILLFTFLIKLSLYLKFEQDWCIISFIGFTRIDLKMTVSKKLKKWRKRENTLTRAVLILGLLFGITSRVVDFIK